MTDSNSHADELEVEERALLRQLFGGGRGARVDLSTVSVPDDDNQQGADK